MHEAWELNPPPGESVGLRLRLSSDLRHFARYRALARRFLVGELLPLDTAEDVVMVLDEALTNVARHSYAAEGMHLIHVQIDVECDHEGIGQHLCITIADKGTGGSGFQPDSQLANNLSRLAGGDQTGLGLLLLFEVMDRVEYRSVPSGENRLVLEKWLRRDPCDLEAVPRMIDEIKQLAGLSEKARPTHALITGGN
ncbi:MAG TPA: ATP-binding protein [Oscillatoriaceae cyanobacterium]